VGDAKGHLAHAKPVDEVKLQRKPRLRVQVGHLDKGLNCRLGIEVDGDAVFFVERDALLIQKLQVGIDAGRQAKLQVVVLQLRQDLKDVVPRLGYLKTQVGQDILAVTEHGEALDVGERKHVLPKGKGEERRLFEALGHLGKVGEGSKVQDRAAKRQVHIGHADGDVGLGAGDGGGHQEALHLID